MGQEPVGVGVHVLEGDVRRMTVRRAIQVLIQHAAANVAGVGCGIRPVIASADKQELSLAIRTMWSRGYGYPMSESDWFNLRMAPPSEES